MTEHYTRNTESVTAWCNKCGRFTEHSVSGGRRGRCMEHEAKMRPPKRRSTQLPLFGEKQ